MGEWRGKRRGREREEVERWRALTLFSHCCIYLSLQSPRGGGGDEGDERENGDYGPLQRQSQMRRLFWKVRTIILVFTISLLAVATDHTIILIVITTFTPFLLTLHTK